MKTYFLKSRYKFTILAGALALVFAISLPFPAQAASKPSCSLTVETATSKATVKKSESVLVQKGDELKIRWESKNATRALDKDGEEISLSGTATTTVKKTTDYSYRFSAGSKKVECSVTAEIVDFSIDEGSLTSSDLRPTLTGTAKNLKTIYLTIRDNDTAKVIYKSKALKVKKGKWRAQVTKKLKAGSYKVEVTGPKNYALNELGSKQLAVGIKRDSKNTTNTKTSGTFSVATIPLLAGGTVKAGMTIPVSYIQIRNTGKEAATLQGFYVKQSGSASEAAFIGFSTIDGAGGSKGLIGGAEGKAPFKNGESLIPTTSVLAPGELKVYTIKAIMAGNLSPYLGQQVVIDVTGIQSTAAKVMSTFPIRGAAWSIGY